MTNPMSTLSLVLAAGLAGVTGYANTICLLRFAAYGTMMTGNIFMMANSITTGNISHAHDGNVFPDLIFYVLIVFSHYFGILLHGWASLPRGFCRPRSSDTTKTTYTMLVNGPIILMLTCAAEYFSHTEEPSIPARWVVFAVAICFGMQSAITQNVIGFAAILATGHLTNMMACMNNHMMRGGIVGKPEQLKVNFAIIYALVVGALAGAWATIHVPNYVFTPATMIQVALLLAVERANESQKLLAASDSATQLVNMDA
jgi:uncharacterized membrane protein YoaK (UPF0700 family)